MLLTYHLGLTIVVKFVRREFFTKMIVLTAKKWHKENNRREKERAVQADLVIFEK